MKKNLLVATAALFISAGAFSQVTWNVEAGMTMNNMSKIDDSKIKAGYMVGVGMDYSLNDMWSIQSGLKFVNKGYKTKKEDSEKESYYSSSEESKTTFSPLYLEIPILAAAKFKVSDNTKIFVNAGPYLALGIAGKAKSKDTYTITTNGKTTSETSEGKMKLFSDAKPSYKEDGESWKDGDDKTAAIMNRFDLGMHIGVGVEINKFIVGLSGEFGFLKTAKSYKEKDMKDNLSYEYVFDKKYNEKTGKSEDISPKNMSFCISVGYKF